MQTDKIKIKEEVQHILEECQSIAENSLYTAQTHFEMAHELQTSGKLKSLVLITFPVGVTVLAALSVFFDIPSSVPKEIPAIIGAMSGLYSVIASLFPSNEAQVSQHTAIGNQLTALRHEADRLYNSYWQEYSREELLHQVELLRVRYQTINTSAAIPSNSAFETAQRRIKAGYFIYDFKIPPSQEQPFLLRWISFLRGHKTDALPTDTQAIPPKSTSD